jgi:HD superfamily phosphohydrolase
MSDVFQKYVQDWLPKDKDLLPFYIGIHDYLEDMITSCRHDDLDKLQSKIICDPLLGYIHLSPLEVGIIDTKIFQRLRKIKQLGLAYLVFPTLGYTRFEHSIGVLGRLNQVLNRLVENNLRFNESDNIKQIIAKHETSIRLAALLHDLGHCLFSHCSERVIENVKGIEGYPDASYIQQLYTTHFSREKKIPFAEIFTISIIGSRRFIDYLDTLNFSNKKEREKLLKNSAKFILGQPLENEPDTVFLAQLLSSGLDADKIDYMLREQHYSGIKLEIDLDRILSKLRIFDLKSYQLPTQLEHLKKQFNADITLKVLGFEKGGQFSFEEFCVARLALHVKIYLHQKVRASEAQLSKYLEIISESPVLKQVHNWLKLPEAILEMPEILTTRFSYDGSLFNPYKIDSNTIHCFKQIDQREIFFRAFAFGPINSFSEGIDFNEIKNLNQNFDNYFDIFKTEELKKHIIEEAVRIIDEYELPISQDTLNEIVIEIPRLLNIQQGQETLYFERANYLPVRWTIPIDKIIIYFQENRALAYIFSPNEIAAVISVASEKVIFEMANKVFSQESYVSKSTFLEYQKLKTLLTDKNFYSKFPRLKPVSSYLSMAEAAEKIKKIQERLKGFKSLKNEYITINGITTFANQFPEDLQDVCLAFLEKLEIYNESLLSDELEKVLEKITQGDSKVGITHLGAVSDSGGRLAYYVRTVTERYDIDEEDFNDAFILNNDKIVFYDDNINSGLQLINIFAELLGKKDALSVELNLNEKHFRTLGSDDAKKKFLNMPIYIVYIVGFEGIEDTIKPILSEALGFDPNNIHIKINKIFKPEKKIFSGNDSDFNHAKKKEFKNILTQIGEKLLTNEGKSPEKVESCKLGYAKAEAMVLFPYNIPTMTITALWCNGIVDDAPWIPLAERRRRTKKGAFLGED